MWILLWFVCSLILSIIMIVRVRNHKGVNNPKLVLCLNIINVVVLVLWMLWVFIVQPGRECMALLFWYLVISSPILVINIAHYIRCLR